MDFEFETTRTALANAFAAAGAELLAYLAIADTAVAAIPDTEPQKYAVAGTLNGILSMVGKMMGEDGAEHPTGDLTEIERIAAYWEDQARRGCVDAFQCALKEAWSAAIAAYLARQAQAEPIGKLTTAAGYYKMFGESDRIYSLPIGEYALYLAPVAHAGAQNAEAIRNQALEDAANACEKWGENKVAKWESHEDAQMRMSARDSAWDALQCAATIRKLQACTATSQAKGADE